MKILLLGCRGQIGWELQRALAPLGDVVALGREGRDGLCGNLEDADGLRRSIRRVRPDVIANAAAFTAVDRAETEPDLAERVNAEAPQILAEEAASADALLVHYSTDFVFDGSGSTPWSEDDSPSPVNVYGATKWRGEEAVRDARCRHLIFRTQWVYAARGQSFLSKILGAVSERDTLEIVDDQTGAPTGAELVADVTAHALRQQGKASGTYHLAARGETTWYRYATFIVDEARRAGWPVRADGAAIVPVGSDAFPTEARRPRNCRLSVDRLERTFGLSLPDWRSGVARALAERLDTMSGD